MHRQPPRILLIDDNKHGLIARRNVLENLGYSVEIATSGGQGLEKFDQQPFDLVVTDYRMPGLSGLQVVRAVRERRKAIPIVILSGYVQRLGLTPRSTGADAVLSKGPTEHEGLVRTIRRLIKKPTSLVGRARRVTARVSGVG